jgi:DNA-binding CsgD family transcriptional regulator
MAAALRRLAQLAGFQGKYAEAERLGSESLSIFERHGDLIGLTSILRELGTIIYMRSDQARARQLLERSAALARQLGDGWRHAEACFNLAQTYHVDGMLDAASELYEQSLAAHRAHGNALGEGAVLNHLGHISILRGDQQQARARLRASLLASREGAGWRRHGFTLSAVAGLVAIEGEAARAICLDAAGRAALGSLGARLAPPMRALYDRQLTAARDTLGEDGVVVAEATGRAMTLEQAVDEALEWLGQPARTADPAGQAADDEREIDRPSGRPTSPGLSGAQAITAAEHGRGAPERSQGPAPDTLTRRERDVAALIARGLTNRQIAEELVVSERTAEWHVANLLGKLDLETRAQLAVWAREHGLGPAE